MSVYTIDQGRGFAKASASEGWWHRLSQGLTLVYLHGLRSIRPYSRRCSASNEERPSYDRGLGEWRVCSHLRSVRTLGYVLYKRPLALFLFPEPPNEPSPKKSFRTLPESEAEKLAPDTRLKLREARGFQLALVELNDGINPAERMIFRDIVFRDIEVKVVSVEEAPFVAYVVRSYLGMEVEMRTE
jgi:hypothetical protein